MQLLNGDTVLADVVLTLLMALKAAFKLVAASKEYTLPTIACSFL